MLKTEFEKLTGIFIPDSFYKFIEKEYLEFDGDKQAFCKAFKKNADGLAEKIPFRFALDQEKKRVTVEKQIENLKKQIQQLEAALEREQEWKPCESKYSVSQSEYDKLRDSFDVKELSAIEAKDLLYEWFGFAREKVEILDSLPVYEVNRHRFLREVGRIDRKPLYNASDWHYICFECAGYTYELYNDKLNII